MARGINQVNIMGRLTRDPELRQTKTDKQIAQFSVAVDRGDKDGTTDYFDVSAWNQLADIVSKYTKKGSKVYVSGRLQLDRWESEGQKKSKVSIVASDVTFLESASDNQGNAGHDSILKNGESVQDRQREVGTLEDQPINLDEIPF